MCDSRSCCHVTLEWYTVIIAAIAATMPATAETIAQVLSFVRTVINFDQSILV